MIFRSKNHLSLEQYLEVNLEAVEETILILQENLRDLLLELGVP